MAFASLFTLPDYIAAVLDDVALMTKAAAKKTAGVAGDDLAPNANRVTGVSAERELPIVWPVAKGSFANKPVLVSAALLLSAFLPQLITPLLTAGGIYLCFEGVEKLLHKFLHRHDAHDDGGETAVNEQAKIKGAIRTDFILSAEIIIIALCVGRTIQPDDALARDGGNRHRHDCFGVRNRRRHRQTRRLGHAADAPPTTSAFCTISCTRNTGTLAGQSIPPTSLSGRFPVRLPAPRLVADESFRQALIPFSNTDAV